MNHPFALLGNLGILNAKFDIPKSPVYSDDLKLLIRACLSRLPRDRPSTAAIIDHLSFMRGGYGGKQLELKDTGAKVGSLPLGYQHPPTVLTYTLSLVLVRVCVCIGAAGSHGC